MESFEDRPPLAVEAQNEYLRLALRAARMGLWVQHLATGEIEWSPETAEILRLDHFDGRAETWLALVHADDRQTALESFRQAVAGSGEFHADFRMTGSDGVERRFVNIGQVRRDAEGRATALVGTVREVTLERQLAAQRAESDRALRESEARFRNVVDSMPSIVFLQDLDGRYLFVNRRVVELSGVPADQWVGRTVHDVLPTYADALIKDFQKVRTLMKPVQEERVGVLPDGRPLAVLASRFPLHLADGTAYAICGIGIDITEQKRLENEVHHAQKMEALGRLAGGVAHDFNNLLTVITGYAELITEEPGSEAFREYLAVINETGHRASLLTRQLLAFSRKAVIEPRVLDLNETVSSGTRMLSRVIGEHVELVTTLEAQAAVHADPGQLEQVLVNLVVNARDAMPGGGRLVVATRDVHLPSDAGSASFGVPEGAYVELSVADTGVGMHHDLKARIFEPFFTSKAPGTGTGLGLATVQAIVQQAGGAVGVDSVPGQGTTFRIVLPAVAPVSAESPAEVTQPAPGIETVLVAEDDASVRRLVGLALGSQGYRLLLAGSGAEALRLAEHHDGPVHLLLTDVVMPDMGGRALAETLHTVRPEVPVLFMSGYLDDAVVREGVAAATDAFIAKPFTTAALSRKVRERLDAGR